MITIAKPTAEAEFLMKAQPTATRAELTYAEKPTAASSSSCEFCYEDRVAQNVAALKCGPLKFSFAEWYNSLFTSFSATGIFH